MTFAAFMRLALYDPEHGFYASRVPGRGAGYRTAPTLSPAFARILVRGIAAMDASLGTPEGFTVVEWGAGGGDLAHVALRSAPPGLRDRLRWRIVEPMPRIARDQRERLDGFPVTWADGDQDPVAGGGFAPVVGCAFANEVLDNAPVHLLRAEGHRLREARVHVTSAGLDLRFDGDPAPEVGHLAERLHAPDGTVIEVSLDAIQWLADAAAALTRGYVLIVDYGAPEAVLRARQPDGTLLAYEDGVPSTDLLARPGERDLTAHLELSLLARCAREIGLRPVATTTQRELLLGWGLREELEALRRASEAASGAEALQLLAARSDAALLAARGGMGDYGVLLLAKDAPDVPLRL